MQLLWDEDNLEHIALHGVDDLEFEDVLFDPNRFRSQAYNQGNERRVAYLGKTEAGRILFVVLAVLEEGFRPVTARDATEREKKSYRRNQ